jgi:hypothetical protein
MPIADQQFALLQQYFAEAVMRPLPSSGQLITVPKVQLPSGWSQPATTVYFIAPVGYPLAKPDCFWADPNLRLSNGSMPQAANITPIPEVGQGQLWFSWHANQWNPNRDNLLTYMRVIEARLKQAR